MNFTEKMQCLKMGFPDYIQALEQEHRKIQVFSKELPLSLELVTQAIEACKQQLSGTTTEYNLNGQSECSEQATSIGDPVLEEFIPIKKRGSTYCDEDEQHSHEQNIPKDDKKLDWLRSVQLWNSDPPAEEDVIRKVPVMMELKTSGSGCAGAFQPFHREERAEKTSESLSKEPSSSTPVAAASSTAAKVPTGHSGGGSSKTEEKEGQRKQRRSWSQDLHKRFLNALQQLGGADTATPKQIKEKMNVDGLTNDEVKSHLQKYRLHSRRPSPANHNSANPQTAPFVLVGNIFVQQPQYAASGELNKVVAPAGIYAPVATHPPSASHTPDVSTKKPELNKLKLFEYPNSSEERANNHSEGGGFHSNSPSSSSSTHTTTTTSPGC